MRQPPSASLCRHCHERFPDQPRGLCFECWWSPARDLYKPGYVRKALLMKVEPEPAIVPIPVEPATLPMPSPAPAGPLCVHCKESLRSRPRGLCWTCYYTPSIRALYPVTSKYHQHGEANGYRNSRLPKCPTSARPGSEEKIMVMIARVQRGEGIFHPEDAHLAVKAQPRKGARHHDHVPQGAA